MSAAANPSTPLPREEWDFDGIAEDEIETCFWWEYVRSGLDAGMRNELAAKYAEVRPFFDSEGVLSLSNYFVETPSLRKRFVLPTVLMCFLCLEYRTWCEEKGRRLCKRAADYFVNRTAWSQLPNDLRKELVSRFVRSASPVLLNELPFEPDENGVLDVNSTASVRTVAFRQAVPNDQKVSWFSLRVDWRFRDAEIADLILKHLPRFRPSRDTTKLTEPKHDYRGSLFPEFFSSPRTHRRALDSLGVLRRRNTVSGWPEYRSVFGGGSDDSELRKATRRAKGAIEWMRDGNPIHLKPLLSAKIAAKKRSKRLPKV